MRPLRITLGVLVAASATVAVAAVSGSAGAEAPIPRAELARVRQATEQFHDVAAAEQAGYELLDRCFSSSEGGMGYHSLKGVDATLDPRAPEALVYAPSDHGLQLVAVEYIVPRDLSNTAPEVLGQHLHENTALGLWVLHAWIWRGNPSGVFKDFNPNVPACP
jgi:hypothetical protein